MTQTALIEAAQAGDSEAFASLLNVCYDTIFRFAFKWSGHRADAEDIAQLACLKLATGLSQFRFDAAFSSWLYRLVINCAKDWQKSQARHRGVEDSTLVFDKLSVSDGPETGIYLRQILEQADSMGEGFKETLLLVFAEGLTHRESAIILGIKESTVSWRIHEIRKRFNLLQKPEGGNTE